METWLGGPGRRSDYQNHAAYITRKSQKNVLDGITICISPTRDRPVLAYPVSDSHPLPLFYTGSASRFSDVSGQARGQYFPTLVTDPPSAIHMSWFLTHVALNF